LISASANGTIQFVRDCPEPDILVVGDDLSRMKQCKEDKKLVVTGGKTSKNMIKVWDLSTKTNIFTGKNVRKDNLELEIPTWESGVLFLDTNCLASCSRYGYVRAYDMRAQRRPIFNYMNEEEQIGFTCLAHHDQLLFVGSNLGTLRAYDRRNSNKHLHTYKGFVGSITDVGCDESGKYLYTSSLDRYVRIHDANSTRLLYQSYVKSKATQILFKDLSNVAADTEDDSDLEIIGEEPSSGRDTEFDELFKKMPKVTENDDSAPPKAKKKKQK
jgi:ribosome biogenesis protein NSA1